MHREANDEVEAMLHIAGAIDGLAAAIRALGNGNAATPMGALEAHGALMREELVPMLANAIESAAHTIHAGLETP